VKARRCAAIVFAALAACSAAPPLPAPERTHPASPEADEAPERAPSQTLVMPERKPPTVAPTGKGH